MKVFSIFSIVTIFFALGLSAAAQNQEPTAREEFESYERNFSQAGTKPTALKVEAGVKPVPKPASKSVPRPKPGTVTAKIKQTVPAKPSPTATAGSPGMKIWLEKQIGCRGAFSLVAPSSVFQTGDCVRAKFRLNFEGYLTVVNYGSSGSVDKIFPLNNQSNKIAPRTDFLIPDNNGWEFYDEAGNENLFFIVSKAPLTGDEAREIELRHKPDAESGADVEVYDRDLKPRTEKNEVFVLAGESRLEKPLIFRLTLKHR